MLLLAAERTKSLDVRAPNDVDGDGEAALICAGAVTMTLTVVSGRTGEVIRTVMPQPQAPKKTR